MFKKVVSAVIILPFLVVLMLCCCVSQASATISKDNHCHDTKSNHAQHPDNSKSNQSHSCECLQSFNAADENAITVLSDSFSLLKINYQKTSPETFSLDSSNGSLQLAYLGPPGVASEIPLYTLYHSLRI
jgi:hypothetical protein